jgi:uncharacterized repeat protein (TIGR01451 family)
METSNGVSEQQPESPSQNPGFVKKTVETPILDSDLRRQITVSDGESSESGGFRGFFEANKYYFLAILIGIVVIAVLAFFAFRKSPVAAPKDANVSIGIDVPSSVASGGEAVYKITVQNNDTQKLVSMQLELTYADGETYENSSPPAQNISGTLFTVPDLIPGQNAVVIVKTKVTGNVNDQKTLDVKLHYQYPNFSSQFVKDQSSTVTLLESNVLIELDGPATTNNAQLVLYTVKYQNNSGADMANTQIKMIYPDGFTFASATPPPDLGTDTWSVGKLANNGQGNIQIQGTFNSANPGESKTAQAEFLIQGQDGQFSVQNTSSFITAISSLPLLVTQNLQQGNADNVINPGDTLNITVHYQNNGTTVATGVNVQVTLASKAIDLSSIRTQGGQVNNNTILWNASGVPQLQSLAPNQGGDLNFSVKINNPAVKDSSKNLSLVSSVQIQSNEYSSPFPGGQLNLKISSPSAVNTVLSFVSGQLPPEAGKSTTYKVHIALTNSSNDFSNGVVTLFVPSGYLPGSVTLAEAGNVQFDSSTNKLTWNVGSLPANTGRFSQPRVLEFQVNLSPSASQVNQSPTLVKTINFTANDLYTNQPVTVSADDITTSDVAGTNGFGNGQVIP